MVGPPLQDGSALVLGVPADDVRRAVAAYRAHHTAGALLDATAYPGVPELLADLTDAGATLAVATSEPAAAGAAVVVATPAEVRAALREIG
ncbi:hypothetical protein ACI79G_05180 [Geodermatophilus sp. SYSU D00779]